MSDKAASPKPPYRQWPIPNHPVSGPEDIRYYQIGFVPNGKYLQFVYVEHPPHALATLADKVNLLPEAIGLGKSGNHILGKSTPGQLDINIYSNCVIFFALDQTNWNMSFRSVDAITLKQEANGNYYKLSSYFDDNKRCCAVSLHAKLLKHKPSKPDGFNVHLVLDQLNSKGAEVAPLEIVIDPDIQNPGIPPIFLSELES